MIIALDKNQRRIFVDDAVQGEQYFCQVCGTVVKPKRGPIRAHHYAHKSVADCKYMKNYNDNAMSEWHKRMQSYFPIESREVRFRDQNTGELHIADVYIEKEDIVIEFQHSDISAKEFRARTEFHLKEKRKVVWVFDESTDNEQNNKLQQSEVNALFYSWSNPRRCIEGINVFPILKDLSICLYTGSKDKEVIRVLGYEKVDEVMLAPRPVIICNDMDAKQFLTTGIDFLHNLIQLNEMQAKTISVTVPVKPSINASNNVKRGPLEQYLHNGTSQGRSFKAKSYGKTYKKK